MATSGNGRPAGLEARQQANKDVLVHQEGYTNYAAEVNNGAVSLLLEINKIMRVAMSDHQQVLRAHGDLGRSSARKGVDVMAGLRSASWEASRRVTSSREPGRRSRWFCGSHRRHSGHLWDRIDALNDTAGETPSGRTRKPSASWTAAESSMRPLADSLTKLNARKTWLVFFAAGQTWHVMLGPSFESFRKVRAKALKAVQDALALQPEICEKDDDEPALM